MAGAYGTVFFSWGRHSKSRATACTSAKLAVAVDLHRSYPEVSKPASSTESRAHASLLLDCVAVLPERSAEAELDKNSSTHHSFYHSSAAAASAWHVAFASACRRPGRRCARRSFCQIHAACIRGAYPCRRNRWHGPTCPEKPSACCHRVAMCLSANMLTALRSRSCLSARSYVAASTCPSSPSLGASMHAKERVD